MNLQRQSKTNITDSTTEHTHSEIIKKTDGYADTQCSPFHGTILFSKYEKPNGGSLCLARAISISNPGTQ